MIVEKLRFGPGHNQVLFTLIVTADERRALARCLESQVNGYEASADEQTLVRVYVDGRRPGPGL